jgi:hypoxanthine phosphoribosyltransferase
MDMPDRMRLLLHPPPPRWRDAVQGVLIPAPRLARRVRQLAVRVQQDFRGEAPVVVSLLNGTVIFLADLIRHLHQPLELDFIGVSSYRGTTRPGRLTFTRTLRLDLRGRDVLLVDDVLDTGRTLNRVLRALRRFKPRRIRICVLLEKRRRRALGVRADYVGFRIPDVFVVGYGLDYGERYRNLPFVGVLRSEACGTRAPGASGRRRRRPTAARGGG